MVSSTGWPRLPNPSEVPSRFYRNAAFPTTRPARIRRSSANVIDKPQRAHFRANHAIAD